MTEQKKNSQYSLDALACILNQANEALNTGERETANKPDTAEAYGIAVLIGLFMMFFLRFVMVFWMESETLTEEADNWQFRISIYTGLLYTVSAVVLGALNKSKLMERETRRLLKVAIKKDKAIKKVLENGTGMTEEDANCLRSLKIIFQYKIKRLQTSLKTGIKSDFYPDSRFDATITDLCKVNKALSCKTKDTLMKKILRKIEKMRITNNVNKMVNRIKETKGAFLLVLTLKILFVPIAMILCIGIPCIFLLVAGLAIMLAESLTNNENIIRASIFLSVMGVIVLFQILKFIFNGRDEPKMSVQEKTLILETAIKNSRAIEEALENETDATEERSNYLRSLKFLLQPKIGLLQGQLQESGC
jgi:hypothetical protein